MTSKDSSGPKRIFRSDNDRLIAGICGGLADYIGVDPVIVRLVWVVLSLIHGGAILLYLLAWLIIPREPYI